ncbi:MAG TPA: pepsin/retropepsin-like aspartic protease family protein [Chthoniobacterales bacterium]
MHKSFLRILAIAVALVVLSFTASIAATLGGSVDAGKFPGYVVVPLGRSEGNHLVIPAVIGSKRVQFIVDTGAPQSVIDAGVARKLQLPPPPPGSGLPAKIAIGEQLRDIVLLPNLIVQGMDLGGGPMTAAKGYKSFTLSLKGKFDDSDGLFGNDILTRQNAILNCKTQQLFLNTDPKLITDPSPALQKAGYVRIPLKVAGHLFAPCKLNGKDFWIIVDTGAALTTVESEVLKSRGIKSITTPVYSSGISLSGRDLRYVPFEAHKLSIGGVSIAQDITARNLEGFFSEEKQVIGLLGAEVLHRHSAVIDFPHKALWLRPMPAVSRRK